MNKALYLVLKNEPLAYETLQDLREAGFNGTVANTESMRTALDYYPGEHHFFNLRHIEQEELQESILCIFVLKEEQLETVKGIIREKTDGFRSLKGFMFSIPLEDYEGSI